MRDVNRTFRKYIAVHITQVIGLLTLMKFVNLETGEIVYVQSAKREMLYMLTKKTKNRDRVKDALGGKIFNHPVLRFRNRRMTRLLLATVNFDRSKFTAR